jgi:hypothetical protein
MHPLPKHLLWSLSKTCILCPQRPILFQTVQFIIRSLEVKFAQRHCKHDFHLNQRKFLANAVSWPFFKRAPCVWRDLVRIFGQKAGGFEVVDVVTPDALVTVHGHRYGPDKEAIGVNQFSGDRIFDEEAFTAQTDAGCWRPKTQDFFDDGECVLELVACTDSYAEDLVKFLADFGELCGVLL